MVGEIGKEKERGFDELSGGIIKYYEKKNAG